jgi:hypothetical protein
VQECSGVAEHPTRITRLTGTDSASVAKTNNPAGFAGLLGHACRAVLCSARWLDACRYPAS